MSMMNCRWAGTLMGAALLCTSGAILGPAGAEEAKPAFASAEEAYKVGQAFISSKNLPKAREALEQGLTLQPDAKLKAKLYRALLTPYRALPEPGPLLDAVDYLARNPLNSSEPTSVRRVLISHVQKSGKGQPIADRYEEALKKDANDPTALFILSGLYAEVLKQPQRAIELTDQLLLLVRRQGGDVVEPQLANELTLQYVKCSRHRDAAGMFEKLAVQEPKLAGWHLKEAAAAWLKAGEKAKALSLARKASDGPPEDRTNLLIHFWHRQLGEIFLETGDFGRSVTHLEKAIESTRIEGYREECRKKLEEAKKKQVPGPTADVTRSRRLDRWPSAKDLARLKSVEGKSAPDVLAVLGHPSRVEYRAGAREVWTYPWHASCELRFVDGRCVSTYYTGGY